MRVGLIARLPWWFKVGAKLVLSRLPLPYGFWRRLGLFRHGAMDQPQRAVSTFRRYFERASAHRAIESGFCSLELGPGDSILAGIVARAYGARRVYLVDTGAYATTDLEACRATARLLREQGLTVPDLAEAASLVQVRERCGIEYLTDGVASLAKVPDASVDFCWSQAVLEHIYRDELEALLRELRRVMRPGSVGLHGVDFRDHLGGGLNNLRFRSAVWESRWFRRAGFYTNRIPCATMIELFERAGFDVQVIDRTRWPQLPTPKRVMASPFRDMPDDVLLTADAELLIRPR